MSIAMIMVGLFVLVVAYLYMFDTLNPTIFGQIVLALLALGLLMYWISPRYTHPKTIHETDQKHNIVSAVAECVAKVI